MCDIITLLICLSPHLNRTHLHPLACISEALLSMTGRITMLGISRWTGKGGSYRTLQRFFNTTIPWCRIHWFLIRHRLLDKHDTILISGDETEVTKSGKKTYGLDRFFSSIFGKAVPGISFLCLSLLSVNNNLSMPVMMEQVIKDEDEASQSSKKKKNTKKKKATKNRKSARRGRPRGSKNKNKKEVELSPYLLWMKALIMNLLQLIGSDITIVYFVFDGAFGNNACLQMVRGTGLHLISKLRCDSALWFPFKGVQSKKGAPKKYGEKLNYDDIPDEYLKDSSVEGQILTLIYQMNLWHKQFSDLLNVVIIVKINLETGGIARVVLFSSDLYLVWDQLIRFYRLRFQIEFNFRDAKQHWGLEDFMNVNPTPVYNGANLAMFMVNLSQGLLRQSSHLISVNDLKAWFRGRKYVQETLKLLPQKPDKVLIERIYEHLSRLGGINLIPKTL